MPELNTSLLTVSLILATLGVLLSFISLVLWVAQRMSTHKIEYVPLTEEDVKHSENLEKRLLEIEEDAERELL